MNPLFKLETPNIKKNKNLDETIKKRLERLEMETNYPTVHINGQRVCGPPRDWNKPVPGSGSEVYVGNLPRFIMEDNLLQIFQSVGAVYKIRLMIDFSGMNRGFAFVTYENSAAAEKAVTYLNNYPIKPNRRIGVFKSVDNRRLFVGGISEDKTREEVREALEKFVTDITDIIMYPPKSGYLKGKINRGYVFVEFNTHRAAAMARRLLNCGVKLWVESAEAVYVDWADPIPEVPPYIMSTVKRLYIRNLPLEYSNDLLLDWLSIHIRPQTILKIHKMEDYAFVHFRRKQDAEIALDNLQGLTIWGKQIEVSWSRPKIYSKENRMNRPAENFCKSLPPKMRKRLGTSENDKPAFLNFPSSSSAGLNIA